MPSPRCPRASAASFAAVLATALAFPAHAAAQGDGDREVAHALSAWIAVAAAPGRDVRTAQRLLTSLPGWSADARGNLTRRVGSGRPRAEIHRPPRRTQRAAAGLTLG